jgi:hypothetical protein
MPRVRLDDISFGDEDVDEVARSWRAGIEFANNWKVTGHAEFTNTTDGYALFVKGAASVYVAVSISIITAAPDANTLGQGMAVQRFREGAVLSDGEEVKVYSNFSVAIPSGTRLVIAPDGDAFQLVAADCPTS